MEGDLKMKKIIITLFLIISLLLSGCANVKNEKLTLEKYELKNNEAVTMNLSFNYTIPYGDLNPISFHVQFITGKHLEVKKERNGDSIKNDLILNVSGAVEREYYVVSSGVYSGQEVEIIQAIITSSDGSITKELKSDFILIKR